MIWLWLPSSLAVVPIEAAQNVLARRICSIRPKTPEGHLARMRTYLLCSDIVNPPLDADSAPYFEDRFMGAMLRDLIGTT